MRKSSRVAWTRCGAAASWLVARGSQPHPDVLLPARARQRHSMMQRAHSHLPPFAPPPHTHARALQLCASQKTPALRRECDSTKGLMQMGTGMMGCSSFKSSQEDACECRRADGTIAQSQYALDQISEAHGAAERGGKGALPGSKAGKRRKRRTRKPRRRKPRSEL